MFRLIKKLFKKDKTLFRKDKICLTISYIFTAIWLLTNKKLNQEGN